MNGTDICPKCGGGDVGGEGVEVEEYGAFQDCFCMGCNHQWRVHFALIDAPRPVTVTKACPNCGSADVEELMRCWQNPNTGAIEQGELATLYPDVYWCNSCQKHPRELVAPPSQTTVNNQEADKTE